jgi:hypothetical protein
MLGIFCMGSAGAGIVSCSASEIIYAGSIHIVGDGVGIAYLITIGSTGSINRATGV